MFVASIQSIYGFRRRGRRTSYVLRPGKKTPWACPGAAAVPAALATLDLNHEPHDRLGHGELAQTGDWLCPVPSTGAG
jgi:hypothetical protein